MADQKLITTVDLPYPPNYGHKVDQYNRWKGFAERGWRLKLICWRSPQDLPTADADRMALGDVSCVAIMSSTSISRSRHGRRRVLARSSPGRSRGLGWSAGSAR